MNQNVIYEVLHDKMEVAPNSIATFEEKRTLTRTEFETSRKARELYQYLNNNKEGLLPYNKWGSRFRSRKKGSYIKGWGYRKRRTVP